MKDDAPDEAQSQLVVPIHDISPSYVYQIHLRAGHIKVVKKISQLSE